MLTAVATFLLYYLASIAVAAILLETSLLALRRRFGRSAWYAAGSGLARAAAYAPAMIGGGHGGMMLALPVAAGIALAPGLDPDASASDRFELLASWIPFAVLLCLTVPLSFGSLRRRRRADPG